MGIKNNKIKKKHREVKNICSTDDTQIAFFFREREKR